MTEIKQGWKVVRSYRHRLESATKYGRITTYSDKRWTERPRDCGPLAVFDSAIAALDFTHGGRWEVWECEYELSGDTKLWNERATLSHTALPGGTVFADRVRLLCKCDPL